MYDRMVFKCQTFVFIYFSVICKMLCTYRDKIAQPTETGDGEILYDSNQSYCH